ncbi:MAG TPA: hypothetical protein VLF93_02180 [Candidatus Saccharimonadales bacterium]|nr:hypothetical protein [Candidatus Saccharimonadales bacterium]
MANTETLEREQASQTRRKVNIIGGSSVGEQVDKATLSPEKVRNAPDSLLDLPGFLPPPIEDLSRDGGVSKLGTTEVISLFTTDRRPRMATQNYVSHGNYPCCNPSDKCKDPTQPLPEQPKSKFCETKPKPPRK